MWRRLCVMMEIFLLKIIHLGNGLSVYYMRKAEPGYFAVDLLAVTKLSRIQCASACSLTNGCSAISYSRNEKLCKLSRGLGDYVTDSAWRTLTLPVREKGLNDQVSTTDMTSHIFDITMTSYSTDTTKVWSGNSVITEATVKKVTWKTADTETIIASNTPSSGFTSVLAEIEETSESSNSGGATVNNEVTCPDEFTATPSGSCFYVSPSFRAWDKASSSCAKHNGYLATITSVDENQELVAIFEAMETLTTNVRIGATYSDIERAWKWVTSESVAWIGMGPDNSDPGADCLAYSFSNAWEWINVPCTDLIHSVCEIDSI